MIAVAIFVFFSDVASSILGVKHAWHKHMKTKDKNVSWTIGLVAYEVPEIQYIF